MKASERARHVDRQGLTPAFTDPNEQAEATTAMFPLVYFVRHGQTDWNAEYRLQGQADTDLTRFGRGQADRNGRRLAQLIDDPAGFDFVASPLRRTRETMERIRAAMGLAAERLSHRPAADRDPFRRLAGLYLRRTRAARARLDAGAQDDKWDFVPPGAGAESYAMLLERIRPWLEAADAADGLRHPWRRHPHPVQDDREQCRRARPRPWKSSQDRVLKLENARLDWL